MEIDHNLFCRCCLSQNQDLITHDMSIETITPTYSEGHSKVPTLYDWYSVLTTAVRARGTSKTDAIELSLTKNVCLSCVELLRSSHAFALRCHNSNEMLGEIKVETSDENLIIYNDATAAYNFAQVFVNDNSTKKRELDSTVRLSDVEPCADKGSAHEDEDPYCKRSSKSKSVKQEHTTKPCSQAAIDDPGLRGLTPYDIDEFVKRWEKGRYICFFCDEYSNSYVDYVEHRRKNHTFDAGMVRVERICNICHCLTTGFVSHLAQHPNYKPNQCQLCEKAFKHQLELRSHLYNHIDLDYKCQAANCRFTSKSQKALRAHIATTQHSSDYHCPYCGIGFARFQACVDHTKDQHNKAGLFPCSKCKGVSLTKNDFDQHKCGKAVFSQHEIDEIKLAANHFCEICQTTFQVKEHYDIHLLTMCDGKEKYFCEICVKLFQTRKQLYHHNRLHVDRNYQCDECGFCTTIESMLKKHKIMHRDDRPFQCSKCSSAFKRKSELVRHQETHNDQLYECYLCEKKFRSSLGIRTHMSLHLPEMKKFPCQVCGKKFSTGHDRNRHAKIHTDAPPKKKPPSKEHPCDICGKIFYNAHDKNKHAKVHAGRSIKCQFCPADFHSSNCLNTHLKEKHGAESFYECKFCGKVLADAIKMKKHLYVHDEFRKPYQCTNCLYDFVKRDRFKTHLMRCHSIEYDDVVHGYKEVANMNETVAECLKVKFPEKLPPVAVPAGLNDGS